MRPLLSVSSTASRFIQASISTSPLSCCCATAGMSPSLPKRSAASNCDASCVAPSFIVDLPSMPHASYRPPGGAARGASATPAQHAALDRIDERPAGAARAVIFLLQPVIPFGLGIGVVDQHE